MSAEFREQVNKVSRPDGYGLTVNTGQNGEKWHYGTVRTPYGFVKVYSEDRATTMSIIHDGYEVSRSYQQGFSHRALVTMAHRFAKEMQP